MFLVPENILWVISCLRYRELKCKWERKRDQIKFFDINDTLRYQYSRYRELTIHKAENHVTHFGYLVPVFGQDG